MDPCTKEESINRLYNFHDEKMKQLAEMEKRQIAIGADVTHIKSRIDNGMSHTIENMHKNLVDIVPIIQRFVSFERRMDDLIWWSAKIGIGVLLSVIAWAIAMGLKLK